jgi:hypothetical protein
MASTKDIEAAKQAILDTLDRQLIAAQAMKNRNVPGMAAKVAALEDKRTELELQDYASAMNSSAMAGALATLKAVTASMNATAARMTTATAFVTLADDLISGASQAITALKGG